MKAPHIGPEPRGKKRTTSLAQVLEALAPVVRPAMLEDFPPNCCIQTCFILRRAFKYFGFDADPLSVTVHIKNSKLVRLLKNKVHIPENLDDRLSLFESESAWGIGIGVGDIPVSTAPGFDGHFVLKVKQMLIDGSLQQAERIQRQIVLDPFLVFEPGPAFLHGKDRPEHELIVNGCSVIYRLARQVFRAGHRWDENLPTYLPTMDKIITRTRERLQ